MGKYSERVSAIPGRTASMIAGNVNSWWNGHDAAKKSAVEITKQADAEIARLRLALNDWACIHASDMCDKGSVLDAQNRIHKAGGTLAYIASLLAQVDA